MNTPVETSAASRNRFEEQWHYRPDTPIQSSPIFEWPLKPLVIWRWFADRWLVFWRKYCFGYFSARFLELVSTIVRGYSNI